MDEELILIAKIRRAHGLKGEVLLESFTMDDRRFKQLKRVFLRGKSGALTEANIETARITANGVLVKFVEYPDKTAADSIQFNEVVIPISERAKLPDGHAYYDEMIGMDVIDDESSEKLGVVRDIMELPAGDVFVIDLLDGTEHLLSSVGEEIRKIEPKNNTLRVKLLEEY